MMNPTASERPIDPTTAEQPAATKGKDGPAANEQPGKGDQGGPGNPFARETARYRKAMREVATAERMKAVMAMLLMKAKGGDLAAAKLLLEHASRESFPASLGGHQPAPLLVEK